MTEYRVVGCVGPSNVRVMTEWFDESIGHVEGIACGLEIRGWKDVEVESREIEG